MARQAWGRQTALPQLPEGVEEAGRCRALAPHAVVEQGIQGLHLGQGQKAGEQGRSPSARWAWGRELFRYWWPGGSSASQRGSGRHGRSHGLPLEHLHQLQAEGRSHGSCWVMMWPSATIERPSAPRRSPSAPPCRQYTPPRAGPDVLQVGQNGGGGADGVQPPPFGAVLNQGLRGGRPGAPPRSPDRRGAPAYPLGPPGPASGQVRSVTVTLGRQTAWGLSATSRPHALPGRSRSALRPCSPQIRFQQNRHYVKQHLSSVLLTKGAAA